MAFKTGNSRTYTVSGTVTGTLSPWDATLDPEEDQTEDLSTRIVFSVTCGLGSVSADFTNAGPGLGTGPITLNAAVPGDVDSSLTNGHGGYDLAIVGSWSIETPVEEWFETYGGGGSGGWHNGVPDAPPWTGIRFFERVAAGTATATITLNGETLTVSAPTTPGAEITETVALSAFLSTFVGSANPAARSAGDVTWTVSGATLSVPPTAASDSDADGDATATVDTDEIRLTASSMPLTEAEADLAYRPDKPVDWAAQVNAMEVPYPESLDVSVSGLGTPTTITAGGGAFSRSFTQRFYTADAEVRRNPVSPTFADGDLNQEDTYAPVSAQIVSTSLAANDDEERLTRLPIRGKLFSGLSLSQAATHTVEGAWTDPTITAIGGATVGVSGGVLSIAAGGSAGGGVATFDPEKGASSYRYLRVRARTVGSASQPFTVVIPPADVSVGANETDVYGGAETPAKEWAAQSGADGTWVDIDLDLCRPDNITDATDDQDSDFPRPTRRPRYMGVWRIPELRFEGVPSGVTLEIDSVQLVRLGAASYLDYLPTFYRGQYNDAVPEMDEEWPERKGPDREVSESETTSYDYRRRFLLGRTDGAQGLDETDLEYTMTVGGVTGTVSYAFLAQSIAQLAAAVNAVDGGITRWPGWSATVDAPVNDASENAHDGYYNRDLYAVYLRGGGALWSGGWSFGFDLAAGSAQAQPLYDEVEWFHGASLFYGSGVLRAAQILRAGGHGLLFDGATWEPLASETVTAKEAGASRGSGSSDSDGYFQTEGPYLHADVPHRTAQLETAAQVLTREFWPRRRGRGVLVSVEELVIEWLSMDSSAPGRLARAGVTSGGSVTLGFAEDYLASSWDDGDTGIAGARPTIRYEWQSASQRLYLAYESGGGILRRHSDDEGGTWSVPTTITSSGEYPAFDILPNGAQHHYWRDSGGAIKGKVFDRQGNEVVGVFTAVASGVDDSVFAVRFDKSASRWFLLYSSGGTPTTVTSADGETFS